MELQEENASFPQILLRPQTIDGVVNVVDPDTQGIDEKYGYSEDTEKLKQKMFAQDEEDDVEGGFLKVYKEGTDGEVKTEKKHTKEQIKFKEVNDELDEENLESQTGP
jgi:hypothetical protein